MLFGKFRTRIDAHKTAILNQIDRLPAGEPNDATRRHLVDKVTDVFYNLSNELDELEETVMKTRGGVALDTASLLETFTKIKSMVKTAKGE